MNGKQKAVPDGANIRGGGETKRIDGSKVSEDKSITIPRYAQGSVIAAILPTGKDDPLTAKEITKLLGMSDERVVTREIAKLRLCRVPVCASNDSKHPGYYLPESIDELKHYLRSLDHRRSELNAVYDGLLSALVEWSGQIRMEEW